MVLLFSYRHARLRVDSPEVLNRTVGPEEVEEIKTLLRYIFTLVCYVVIVLDVVHGVRNTKRFFVTIGLSSQLLLK